MKKSAIHFDITLDKDNVPEDITWNATDKPGDDDHTKAISIAVWDDPEKNTMRLDLWTKDMPVTEMKKFYIDALGGMAQSILTATGDEQMSGDINELCDKLGKKLEAELKGPSTK
jgi:gliding motility-associated protein GldC